MAFNIERPCRLYFQNKTEREVKLIAATRLIPLHVNKGKTIAETITERTDYPKNPNKTKNGELVTGYECDPAVVDAQFLLSKK